MSAGAALIAIQQGVTNVAALKGGWAAWQRAGYPVEGKLASQLTPAPTVAPTATPRAAAPLPAAEEVIAALGDPNAPVTILEFFDFQCGYCRQHVLQTLPAIKETYIDTGQVYYILKDLPLSFHPNAQKAAEAARCAGAQGAYWPMHEQLFEYQSQWSGQNAAAALDSFVAYAGELDLDTETFRACVESGRFAAQIAQHRGEAQQAGISGTPSFLINGRVLVGAYPFENFQQLIEAALQK